MQLAGANNAAKWRHPRLPHPGATHRCDAGSLYRLSATIGAHVRFPLGGHASPHADNLYWCSPWVLSVPVPFLLIPLFLFFLDLGSDLGCLLAILPLVLTSLLGGPAALSPCVPPPPSSSSSAAPSSSPPSPDPPGGSILSSVGCRGLAARWSLSRRLINYMGHYPLRLLLWRPPPP